MDSVIVGVDNSDSSTRAVEFAAERGLRNRWKVVVLHVIPWSPYSFQTPSENEHRHREREAELATLGLLNHLAPLAYGGAGLGRDVDRQLHETIAGGCFNTWLVWAQHAPLVGRLAASAQPLSPLAERVLRGEVLVGAAISDVRRFPHGSLRARRSAQGWRVDGTASWVTGWGLSTALVVAAVEHDTRTVVTALVPVGAGLRSEPLDLTVVRGSRTERVHLDRVLIAEEHVIAVQSLDEWQQQDLGVASDARPHHFGRAATLLDELGRSDQPLARQVAEQWRPRIAELRRRAYALSDAATEHGGDHRLAERLRLKAASGEALATLSRALVVARSGHGITTDDTAQLHAASASFVLVQGQTRAVRDTQLTTILNQTTTSEQTTAFEQTTTDEQTGTI